MVKTLIVCIVILAAFLVAPFFSWGASYDTIVADAALLFGIDEDEYELTFYTGTLLNAADEEVSGTFSTIARNVDGETKTIFIIRVRKYTFRPLTISTIFHEFAHAAQYKYDLLDDSDKHGEFSREQHAELLAFDTLWRSDHWWNSVHMLYMHMFWGKPADYRAPGVILNTMVTGARAV